MRELDSVITHAFGMQVVVSLATVVPNCPHAVQQYSLSASCCVYEGWR